MTKLSLEDELRRGFALQQRGNTREAESVLRILLSAYPDEPRILNALGAIAGELQAFKEAEFYLYRAAQLLPKDPSVLRNLGIALTASGKFNEAIDMLERSIALAPDSEKAWNNIAHALNLSGDPVRALEFAKHLKSMNPNHLGARMRIVDAHSQVGAFDKAAAEAQEIIQRWPVRAAGYIAIAPLRKFEANDPVIDAAAALLANTKLDPSEQPDLHYALGKMLADAGRVDQAFAHFSAANTSRSGVSYNRAQAEQQIDAIIATYSAKLFESRRGHGCLSKAPIFVVGMPRSGTTLVESLLLTHADVATVGENSCLNLVTSSLRDFALRDGDHLAVLNSLSPQAVQILGHRYVRAHTRLVSDRRKTRIVDKLPHNFMNLGVAALILPEAKFIHVRRAPMATAWSIWTQSFSPLHAYAARFEDIAHQYALYSRLMKHWRETLGARILDMSYEDVARDPILSTKTMIEHVGLPYDEGSFLDRGAAVVNTASVWQVRQPIHERSIERWKDYRHHLEPLVRAFSEHGIQVE